ncbi:MAG: ATP-binding protein [Bacteroidales bacterium]|nr:ATP-binding protein [Bacteroidales bacterium]
MQTQTQKNNRKAKCILLVGGNGCGKSTLSARLMQSAERGLIMLPTFDDWAERYPECGCSTRADFQYMGIHHRIVNTKEDFNAVFRHFYNGVLVCDDPRVYIPANIEQHPIKYILARRRQMMVDIIFQAHGFGLVPPALYNYFTDIVIFNTSGGAQKRKAELGDLYDTVCQTMERVKAKAVQNPHYFERIETGL